MLNDPVIFLTPAKIWVTFPKYWKMLVPLATASRRWVAFWRAGKLPAAWPIVWKISLKTIKAFQKYSITCVYRPIKSPVQAITVWRDQKFWPGPRTGPEIWRDRDQDRDHKYDGTGTGTRNMTGLGPGLVRDRDWDREQDHDQERDKDL